MRFSVRDTSRFAREVVFAAHRDEIERIAGELPDVQRVEIRGRTRRADGWEEQTTLWVGSPSVLPLLLRPVVPPQMLQWRQVTRWDPVAWVAQWTIDVPGLGPAIEAAGENRYLAEGDGCTIAIDGDFAFRPDRVPALDAIPKAAVPVVEKAVVAMIVPMIERTGAAVRQYLERR
ncbi:MAG: hypothetical protein ABMA64_15670 [Myxococcota bacterium]